MPEGLRAVLMTPYILTSTISSTKRLTEKAVLDNGKTTPLTNIKVKQVKPALKDGKMIATKLSDGGGLQIKVAPNGTCSIN